MIYFKSLAQVQRLGRHRGSINYRPMVLLVARELPQPFTLTDLVLACWKADPEAFGMPGVEEEYPSDRRVYHTLCGKRGLVGRGHFTLVAPLTYRVAEEAS